MTTTITGVTATIGSNGDLATQIAFQIDDEYEFSAPKFFDFIERESKFDIEESELWFERALSYAPSPFIHKVKVERIRGIQNYCINFSTIKEDVRDSITASHLEVVQDPSPDSASENMNKGSGSTKEAPEDCKVENLGDKDRIGGKIPVAESCKNAAREEYTPKAQTIPVRTGTDPPVKRTASSYVCKSKNQIDDAKSLNISAKKAKSSNLSTKKSAAITDFAQSNQAIKRQKLEGGRSRPILDIRNRVLPHKSKPSLETGLNLSELMGKCTQEERRRIAGRRKVYVKEPFISMAEMVEQFQSKTRAVGLSSCGDASTMKQGRQRLTLTAPQEPQLETASRSRPVKAKSREELEEEMMSNFPKFKALPLNAKILETISVPEVPRRTPQPPKFKEFHLKTVERSHQQAPSLSTSADSSSCLKTNQGKSQKLKEPKTPLLETAMRYRPPKVKSSQEMEEEELDKVPKFKARPLNRSVLESRGDLGVFCKPKPQPTVPQEFHFTTGERVAATASKEVAHIFNKLSLKLEPKNEKPLPRITIPNPFHLQTEERGQEKERKIAEEVMRKEFEEERTRVPRAKPYPYTTDYPEMPPKPEPKSCTKPEAFQLKSLVRHEEELQRKMLEREKIESEEAEKRVFRAQPIARDDPIPVPVKVRIPLTQVQEFQLLVDRRAADREEFDKMIKEKEMVGKRLREEEEAARVAEEEKAVKQMRRTMVHRATPLPSFDNPFIPHKSSKGTANIEPSDLHADKRNERRLATATALRDE